MDPVVLQEALEAPGQRRDSSPRSNFVLWQEIYIIIFYLELKPCIL